MWVLLSTPTPDPYEFLMANHILGRRPALWAGCGENWLAVARSGWLWRELPPLLCGETWLAVAKITSLWCEKQINVATTALAVTNLRHAVTIKLRSGCYESN